jgi:hypothetical protein
MSPAMPSGVSQSVLHCQSSCSLVTGATQDTVTRLTVQLFRVPYYVLETGQDIDRIAMAFEEARRTHMPVAVLVGAEYDDEEIDAA